MIKYRLIILFCCFGFSLQMAAQKFDYNWLTGYNTGGGADTASGHYFGFTHFDFNRSPVEITRQTLSTNFRGCNTAISDSIGNLLFYSNGVTIRNKSDQVVENGDNIGWSYVLSDWYTDIETYGEVYPQFQLVLPNPKQKNIYNIFYFF